MCGIRIILMFFNQNQRFFIKVNNNPTLGNTYIIFKGYKVGMECWPQTLKLSIRVQTKYNEPT
jgi:hypothetical protein